MIDPKEIREFIGVTPDINEDYVDESQLTEEVLGLYSLLKNNSFYNKSTKISKTYFLSEQYDILLKKKQAGTLTQQEERLFSYLQSTLSGN